MATVSGSFENMLTSSVDPLRAVMPNPMMSLPAGSPASSASLKKAQCGTITSFVHSRYCPRLTKGYFATS